MKKTKTIEQLRAMAERAERAQYAFSVALEAAKQRATWEAECEIAGISPDANQGDWMC